MPRQNSIRITIHMIHRDDDEDVPEGQNLARRTSIECLFLAI